MLGTSDSMTSARVSGLRRSFGGFVDLRAILYAGTGEGFWQLSSFDCGTCYPFLQHRGRIQVVDLPVGGRAQASLALPSTRIHASSRRSQYKTVCPKEERNREHRSEQENHLCGANWIPELVDYS